LTLFGSLKLLRHDKFDRKTLQIISEEPLIILFYSTFVIPFISYAQLSLTSVGTPVVIDFSTAVSGVNAASLNSVAVTEFMNSSPSSGKLDADAWAILLDGAYAHDGRVFVRGWDGPFALEVYDLQGRRVIADAFEAGAGNTGWATGVVPYIYLLRCMTSQGVKSIKLRL
jgi:hypothetical protein